MVLVVVWCYLLVAMFQNGVVGGGAEGDVRVMEGKWKGGFFDMTSIM